MNRRPKIAFVTPDDPTDRRSWSGINHYMAAALEKHCGDVRFLGPVRSRLDAAGRAVDRASRRVFRKGYDFTHSVVLARRYAQIIQRRLDREAFDVIFAASASTDVAYLRTAIPIVYLSGTTFRLMNGYYPYLSNLVSASVREGDRIEGLAIRKASLLLYPSEWAARSARADYGADGSKIHVIPYGANLDEIPPRERVLARKESGECRLLFLGVDWERKGGEIAFETLLALESLGVQAHLTVCGSVPPPGLSHERMKTIPFLDKGDAVQRQALADLLSTSDFLLLPTRSECFGIVFCEASAFGLPVIATDTGGVSGAVRPGANGVLLSPSARGGEYAEVIRELYADPGRYRRLVRSARDAFEDRLNWDAWGRAVGRVIAEMLDSRLRPDSAA
ncbi:MAG: glycosyltransferase family 4 protein [Thermoanaerobaculia bacterium]